MVYSCTDWHEVDEDARAIPIYGGDWNVIDAVGVALRNMYYPSSSTFDIVAFAQKNK